MNLQVSMTRALWGIAGGVLALAAAGVVATPARADCAQAVGSNFAQGTLGEANLNAGIIAALNDDIDSAGYDVRALLVVRGCRLVFERYKAGLGRENIHVVHSVTKSFTTSLAGNLLMTGALSSLDVPLATLLAKPGSASADEWRKAERITLRNALGMASGIQWRHVPTGLPIYDPANDRVYEAIKSPMSAEPGTRFNYSDGDATLYGAAIAAAARTDLLSLARMAMFRPMDFGSHEWNYKDREGRYPAGWSLRLRPMDVAKLGQLYLQEGRWNGTPIFAPPFRQTVWSRGPSPNYGLGWWIQTRPEFATSPVFFANGWKGQRVYVYPKQDMFVVLISSLPDADERALMAKLPVEVLRAAETRHKPDAAAELRIAASISKGFRGTTRVDQAAQDIPGR